MAHVHVRRSVPRPIPARQGRHHRGLKALVLALFFLIGAGLAARAYFLSAYAPPLQREVRVIPSLVRRQLSQRHATYVPYDQISPNMRNAIVSIEDRRFYQHPGVDPVAMVRAFWINLWNQHVDQGGSTLEEQLAKRAIVHDDRAWRAKLHTIALAWALDRDFSKREVLALYLNEAYYGEGAYGIGSAAQTYFGVSPARLTVQQAAFLAALPQAPSVYGAHPRYHAVVYRYHRVLADMQAMNYITAREEQAAWHTPLVLALPNPR